MSSIQKVLARFITVELKKLVQEKKRNKFFTQFSFKKRSKEKKGEITF